MSNQSDIDPYATPKAETIINTDVENAKGYRIEKKLVAVQDGAKLPRICFFTGEDAPTSLRNRITLYWINPLWGLILLVFIPVYLLGFSNHPPKWNLFLFALFPIYSIVFYSMRSKVTFNYCISYKTNQNRKTRKIISFTIFILCVTATIVSFMLVKHNQIYLVFGVIGAVISAIVLFIATNLNTRISVKKHKDGWFYLSGADKDFLKKAQNEEQIP